MSRLRWDGRERAWVDRLQRFDRRGAIWLPWHRRLTPDATGSWPWGGIGVAWWAWRRGLLPVVRGGVWIPRAWGGDAVEGDQSGGR